jgi:L-phenylalanine/L-methionine N-acetyltransferase
MMQHTIRDARPSDATALCEAERAVVREFDALLVSDADELSEAAFAERIAMHLDGRAKVLIAELSGEIVGHASLYPMTLRRVAHVLRLDMCVHLGHWRQGYGASLLAELLVWARDRSGAHKVELLVRSSNAAAIALYERAGFHHEGRMKDRVRRRSGGFVDDLSMGLLLERYG